MAVMQTYEDQFYAIEILSRFKRYINKGNQPHAKHDRNLLVWAEMKYREKDQTIKSIAESYNINPTSVSQISRRLERQFEEFKKKAQLDI
jgi:DNA-binding MarR family transcriptional regulator